MHQFSIKHFTPQQAKEWLIQSVPRFEQAIFLDSNHHQEKYSRYQWLAALGAQAILSPTEDHFSQLKKFHQNQKNWLFGHLNYDLKNKLEPTLPSVRKGNFAFANMCFFVPQMVIYCQNNQVYVESALHSCQEEFIDYLQSLQEKEESTTRSVQLTATHNKAHYLNTIQKIKNELQYGHIYELNYCKEFTGTATSFNPAATFRKLNHTAQAPFAAFYRNQNDYLICASPERYVQKQGAHIISQPIKGTAKRHSNLEEDNRLKAELKSNEKERSENVMITDLVRNDLSKTAKKGSVTVSELFGIYSFNSVHQMISTVNSQLKEDQHFTDVLRSTFPMGSMTGAPKLKAMQLIDSFETFARNLFSGAVGYVTPNGDFDFNVVIRSLLYNSKNKEISARVGSAITMASQAEKEYEECLLKAENLFRILKND